MPSLCHLLPIQGDELSNPHVVPLVILEERNQSRLFLLFFFTGGEPTEVIFLLSDNLGG